MSGGSFNYLCDKYADDLMTSGMSDAEHMVDALAGTGYAQDAAQETASVIAEIRAAQARLEAKINRLRPIWKAMEWWQSCDWSENDLKRALAEYRGLDLPDCKRCLGMGLEPNLKGRYGCQNPDCARGKDVELIR